MMEPDTKNKGQKQWRSNTTRQRASFTLDFKTRNCKNFQKQFISHDPPAFRTFQAQQGKDKIQFRFSNIESYNQIFSIKEKNMVFGESLWR